MRGERDRQRRRGERKTDRQTGRQDKETVGSREEGER